MKKMTSQWLQSNLKECVLIVESTDIMHQTAKTRTSLMAKLERRDLMETVTFAVSLDIRRELF